MSTYLPTSIVFLTLVSTATDTSAQGTRPLPTPVATDVALSDGRVSGVVLDEAGAALGDVRVLATGTTMALVRSDSRGRFALVLPAGEYLIRAVREGYISTFREAVRVEPSRSIERQLRLIRRADSEAAVESPQAVVPAPAADPAPVTAEIHGHGEMAWRLRHLRRTVLRDVAPSLYAGEPASSPFAGEPAAADRLVNRLVMASRLASSFFTDTDFAGHINLVATSSIAGVPRPAPAGWPSGVADVFVGAPVGASGDWSIRGAMASGDRSSWGLLGEYEARSDQRHEVRLAVSYGTQGVPAVHDVALAPAASESRSAGAVEASDRWQVRPSLEIDYGVRFDHYDYLSETSLFSPWAGVRAAVAPGTIVLASTSRRAIAPGAAEFEAPSAAGPWLPPSRRFSALVSGTPLRPEDVQRHVIGVERAVGPAGAGRVSVEWFAESADNQMATLFGLGDASEAGRYYVATVGHVTMSGWRVRVEGDVGPHVQGRVEYADGRSRWTGARGAARLRQLEPTVARGGRESISDLRTSLDVQLPPTATEIAFAFQVSQARPFVEHDIQRDLSARGFDLQVRQRLPYQPLDAGLLNALFTLSTLFHHHESGSLYDEILTVRTPARLTAGIQLGF
jgi:hypothetical protein